MKRFRLISALAVSVILSIALVAVVSAEGQRNPSNLTAEQCGDGICLSWTTSSDDFDFQQISLWQGNPYTGGKYILGASVEEDDTEFRIPFNVIQLAPHRDLNETVYSLRVTAMSTGYYYQITDVAKSEVVTIELDSPVDSYVAINAGNLPDPNSQEPCTTVCE